MIGDFNTTRRPQRRALGTTFAALAAMLPLSEQAAAQLVCAAPTTTVTLTGTLGFDFLAGSNLTNDRVIGQDGNDILRGCALDDYVTGNIGVDHIHGNSGNDLLQGGADNDFIAGGQGDDCLIGGMGDDVLLGGQGDDQLDGGPGNDRFIVRHGDGVDTINDPLGVSTVVFRELPIWVTFTAIGSNLLATMIDPATGSATVVTLVNFTTSTFSFTYSNGPVVPSMVIGPLGQLTLCLSGNVTMLAPSSIEIWVAGTPIFASLPTLMLLLAPHINFVSTPTCPIGIEFSPFIAPILIATPLALDVSTNQGDVEWVAMYPTGVTGC